MAVRDPRFISELQIHIAVIDALRHFAAPGVVWFHCPNGELRNKRAAAKLKAMGVRPGVADICLIIPLMMMAVPLPAYLELKSAKGVLSKEQRDFRDEVRALGCAWAVASSVDEALSTLIEWGALRGIARALISPAAKARRAA